MTMTMTKPPSISFPQPPPTRSGDDNGSDDIPRQHYKYVPYDIFETNWIGDPRRLPFFVSSPSPASAAAAAYNDMSSSDNNNGNANSPLNTIARYSPGTLVWVLLSKGKPKYPNNDKSCTTTTTTLSGCADALAIHKKRRDKKNKRRLMTTSNSHKNNNNNSNCTIQSESIEESQVETAAVEEEDLCINESAFITPASTTATTTTTTTTPTVNYHSRKEFFLRARVIADDEEVLLSSDGSDISNDSISQWEQRRILVRYSKGATYRVHAYNLIPVLEPIVHNANTVDAKNAIPPSSSSYNYPPLVVLVPETNIYRRVAKVHTTPEDTFMEIGCDYGITVDKIQQSLEEAGCVPRVWTGEDKIISDESGGGGDETRHDEEEGSHHRISCLGIDKSKESIDIANERYDI
jgi:hypothetical protein